MLMECDEAVFVAKSTRDSDALPAEMPARQLLTLRWELYGDELVQVWHAGDETTQSRGRNANEARLFAS